jgi:hypothetical protein
MPQTSVQLNRKALDRNPNNPSIWVQYGHALKETGGPRDPDKLAQAETAYCRAMWDALVQVERIERERALAARQTLAGAERERLKEPRQQRHCRPKW